MSAFTHRFLSLTLWTVVVSQVIPYASAQDESEPARRNRSQVGVLIFGLA